MTEEEIIRALSYLYLEGDLELERDFVRYKDRNVLLIADKDNISGRLGTYQFVGKWVKPEEDV